MKKFLPPLGVQLWGVNMAHWWLHYLIQMGGHVFLPCNSGNIKHGTRRIPSYSTMHSYSLASQIGVDVRRHMYTCCRYS